jgi:hypothetical protein
MPSTFPFAITSAADIVAGWARMKSDLESVFVGVFFEGIYISIGVVDGRHSSCVRAPYTIRSMVRARVGNVAR